MTDKRTVINLLPGQEIELRSTKGIRVSYPLGKPRVGDPKAVLNRDTGTWVPPPVEPPPVEPPPVEPPPVEPPPVEPPPASNSRTVTSIVDLLAALDDNTLDEIVVKNGTYTVAGASSKGPTALWIGAKFADRTRPILVRAETKGGVMLSGAGANHWIGLSFIEGAHDQTWDGFTFINAEPTQTGVIVFGGTYGVLGPQWVAPHHITLRNIKIAASITSSYAGSGDHSIYIADSASPGVHDILVENYTVDGAGGVNTALTMYHSAAGFPNASNVTVRNIDVTGTNQAIEIWDATINGLLIEKAAIRNVRSRAVRYETGKAVTLKDMVSTGTPSGVGFYSSKGATPADVTFINCSFG